MAITGDVLNKKVGEKNTNTICIRIAEDILSYAKQE